MEEYEKNSEKDDLQKDSTQKKPTYENIDDYIAKININMHAFA